MDEPQIGDRVYFHLDRGHRAARVTCVLPGGKANLLVELDGENAIASDSVGGKNPYLGDHPNPRMHREGARVDRLWGWHAWVPSVAHGEEGGPPAAGTWTHGRPVV